MPDPNEVIFKEPVTVPGESNIQEQLSAIKPLITEDDELEISEDDLNDPIMKAKKLVVDNYNLHRNKSRVPAMTPELVNVLWYSGTRGNFKANLEFTVVHGLMYVVSYNARRGEAIIEVHKKLSTIQLKNV